MKKRNLLVAALLVLTMFITACSADPSPFEGKWKGTCDLTQYIVDEMTKDPAYADYKQYMNFENLAFVIDFTFEGDDMSMSVDETSIDTFVANVETGMYNMMDTMARDACMTNLQSLAPDATTLDEIAVELDYESAEALLDYVIEEEYGTFYDNYEDYLNKTIAAMDLKSMVSSLSNDLALSGTYEYDEEDGILTIYYDDDTYEDMKFAFSGDTLTITVSDTEVEFDIVCEKVSE